MSETSKQVGSPAVIWRQNSSAAQDFVATDRVRTATAGKLTSLQSLRLLAALGVLQFHLWNNYLGVTIGHPGTDYFLVLVGVVAAYSQARHIPGGRWQRYLAARGVRLYVTFIPLFLLALAFKWQHADWDWIWRSFLFLPLPDRTPVITSAWMISHFVLFYFVFAFVIWARREWVIWVIFGVWTAGIVLYTWSNWSPRLPFEWAILLFEERNLDFILGYCIGVLLRDRRISYRAGKWIVWVGLLGIILSVAVLNSGTTMLGRSLWAGIPVAVFTLGVATLEQHGDSGALTTVITHPWLVWLGGASYVIYLSQGILLHGWSTILPITPLLVPVITLCVIVFSAIGYKTWEAPVLSQLRKHFTFIRY